MHPLAARVARIEPFHVMEVVKQAAALERAALQAETQVEFLHIQAGLGGGQFDRNIGRPLTIPSRHRQHRPADRQH